LCNYNLIGVFSFLEFEDEGRESSLVDGDNLTLETNDNVSLS